MASAVNRVRWIIHIPVPLKQIIHYMLILKMICVLFIPLYFTHPPTHLPYGSHQLVLCIEESDFLSPFFLSFIFLNST